MTRNSSPPKLPGVSHSEVEVDGVRLHVAEAGSGPPLLLLHGWPQHWWCWRLLIPRLAESYRVIAPDLRGSGWSEAPPGDYSKATFATDATGLIDALGLDRVRVIGHDWGAYAAFLLALDQPHRVERLLALDISPPWLQNRRPTLRQLGLPLFASYQALLAMPFLGRAALTGSTALVRGLIRAGSGPDARWTNAELDTYATVLRDPARAAASSACYRTFLTRELPVMIAAGDRAGRLRVPVLLVMGAASPLYRTLDPRPQPNLRLEVIPDAGHFLPEEAPEQVLEIAEGWFQTPATSATPVATRPS